MEVKLINKKIPLALLVVSVIMITTGAIFTLLLGIGLVWGLSEREADAIIFVPWLLVAVTVLVGGILLRKIRKE